MKLTSAKELVLEIGPHCISYDGVKQGHNPGGEQTCDECIIETIRKAQRQAIEAAAQAAQDYIMSTPSCCVMSTECGDEIRALLEGE